MQGLTSDESLPSRVNDLFRNQRRDFAGGAAFDDLCRHSEDDRGRFALRDGGRSGFAHFQKAIRGVIAHPVMGMPITFRPAD